MEYTRENPPPGSPGCWSRQYDQSTSECRGCPFNLSCAKVFRGPTNGVQVYPSLPQVPAQHVARPAYVPPIPPPPAPTPPQGFYQQQPRYPQPYQQSYGWVPPPPPPIVAPVPPQPVYTARTPQPMAAAYVPVPPPPQPPPVPPGQPPYEPFAGIFGQYPGEPVHVRLGKNILLRALEAIFTELARFFHYWTWPYIARLAA